MEGEQPTYFCATQWNERERKYEKVRIPVGPDHFIRMREGEFRVAVMDPHAEDACNPETIQVGDIVYQLPCSGALKVVSKTPKSVQTVEIKGSTAFRFEMREKIQWMGDTAPAEMERIRVLEWTPCADQEVEKSQTVFRWNKNRELFWCKGNYLVHSDKFPQKHWVVE